MKTQLLLCAAALASAVAIAADAPKHNAKPKEGLVADAKTATAIAVAVWEPIYGAEKLPDRNRIGRSSPTASGP